jgi:hypothetical protein
MRVRSPISVRSVFILVCIVGALTGTALAAQERSAEGSLLGVESVVFRQGEAGYSGCVDTRISEERPDANFGDGELIVGMKGRVGTLIRFDVSSIPTTATVQEATLNLLVSNYGQRTEPIVVAAYTVFRPWEEMEATWHQATDLEDWGKPGCNDVTSDRSGTPLSQETVYERDEWYTWSVTSAAQNWVRRPDSNKGVLLQQTSNDIGGEFDIRQSEYSSLDVRPYLLVRYTLAPPTPSVPPTPEPPPCLGTPEPGAVFTILQEGVDYSGAEDTMFNFDDRETLYADEWFMRVGYRKHYSGLIKYDVSSIPQGSRIVCAALSLFAERWSGGPLDVGAYAVTRENAVDEATWTWAASGVPWQEGGCNGPDDRLQTPESVISVHTIYRWYHFDLTRVVDGWVNGSLANNGVSLQPLDRLDDDTAWFAASDDATVENRPRLVVLFVPPAGWEPTATPLATVTPTSTPTPTITPTPRPPVTQTFQEGVESYAGCADTRISAERVSSNFASSELKVGAKQWIATLVRFDLSSIPSDATVESATLSVYGYHLEGDAGFDLGVYRVKQPWLEGDATWEMATASTAWGTPGCNSTSTDRAEAASDALTVQATGWYTWSVRDDVQGMVSAPQTNEGWLLMQPEAMLGVLSMYSSEYASAGYRPKLEVTYSVP